MVKKFTFEFVKNYIESEGIELISEEYVNINSKLKMKCSSGHIFEINFKQFKQGFRCPIDSNPKLYQKK